MTVEVSISEHGSAAAARHLVELGVRAEFVGPAYEELAAIFHADEERRFTLQGPGWKPLADVTVQQKGGDRIMVDSGTLRRSLTTAAGVDRVEGDTVKFGTDVEYARFHQYGTVNMPRRQVVGISPPARRAMTKVLERWIVHGAGL